MGKKFFASMIAVVIATFAGYNVYTSQQTGTLSDLALANVEALAFEFDGTNWDKNDHWYNGAGGKWTPVLVDCTVTIGVDCFFVHTTTISGQMVVCSTGSGNCLDGTPCTTP